jgi:Fe-S-cluster containining protein
MPSDEPGGSLLGNPGEPRKSTDRPTRLPKLGALKAAVAKAMARGILVQGNIPPGSTQLALVAKARHYLMTYLIATKAIAASAIARELHRDFERTTARYPADAVACRQGCAWCCYYQVTATAPELFRIADAIRRRPDRAALIARIRAENEITQGMKAEQRYDAKRACPLLSQEKTCLVYEERPLNCRAWASSSAVACESAHGDRTVPIPVISKQMDFRVAYSLAFRAALRALAWPIVAYELTEGLARLVEDPSAEAQWIGGTDVLAGVQADETLPEQHRDIIETVAKRVHVTGCCSALWMLLDPLDAALPFLDAALPFGCCSTL